MSAILPGPQRVNLEQLQHAIDFERAQISLHETWIEAWQKRGEYERSYTRHCYHLHFGNTIKAGQEVFLENYMRWHKQHSDAEVAIRQLQLAQLKSHLAIQEAMMREAKSPLFTGGNLQAS
jgi:hypothetical protein